MAIPVIFSNSTAGTVEVYRLIDLINHGKIIAYKKLDHWISSGIKPEDLPDAPARAAADETHPGAHHDVTHPRKNPSREENNMAISVIFKNNKKGMIDEYLLDDLIRDEKIKAFRRSSGWARIGRDPIRERWNQSKYAGQERRKRELPPDYFL